MSRTASLLNIFSLCKYFISNPKLLNFPLIRSLSVSGSIWLTLLDLNPNASLEASKPNIDSDNFKLTKEKLQRDVV